MDSKKSLLLSLSFLLVFSSCKGSSSSSLSSSPDPDSSSSSFSVSSSLSTEGKDFNVAVLSDLHYLSPSLLREGSSLLGSKMAYGESSDILDMVLTRTGKRHPTALLIAGDLTKDGEKIGHEEVSAKLLKFEKDYSVPVYVIPGNHDINAPAKDSSISYEAERTTPSDFHSIYSEVTYSSPTILSSFVPEEGTSAGGLSYSARIQNGVTLLALDDNLYSKDSTSSKSDNCESGGKLSPALVLWAKEQLRNARSRNDFVIGLSHHGFLEHFQGQKKLASSRLVANDSDTLSSLSSLGLHVVFTGHGHTDDVSEETFADGNSLVDVETGSLISYPSSETYASFSASSSGKKEEDAVLERVTGGILSYQDKTSNSTTAIPDLSSYLKEKGYDTIGIDGIVPALLSKVLAGSRKRQRKYLSERCYPMYYSEATPFLLLSPRWLRLCFIFFPEERYR